MNYRYVCSCMLWGGKFLICLSKACITLCEVYLAKEKFDDASELTEIAWAAVGNRPAARIFCELRNLSKPTKLDFLYLYVVLPLYVKCLCAKKQFSKSEELLIRFREDTKYLPPEHQSINRCECKMSLTYLIIGLLIN